MSECEGCVHINTETVSTSYRSLEEKSCLIGWLTSKIPHSNPSSRLFLFYKIVSRRAWDCLQRCQSTYHTTHFNRKITPNKLLLEVAHVGWDPDTRNMLINEGSFRHCTLQGNGGCVYTFQILISLRAN